MQLSDIFSKVKLFRLICDLYQPKNDTMCSTICPFSYSWKLIITEPGMYNADKNIVKEFAIKLHHQNVFKDCSESFC